MASIKVTAGELMEIRKLCVSLAVQHTQNDGISGMLCVEKAKRYEDYILGNQPISPPKQAVNATELNAQNQEYVG